MHDCPAHAFASTPSANIFTDLVPLESSDKASIITEAVGPFATGFNGEWLTETTGGVLSAFTEVIFSVDR